MEDNFVGAAQRLSSEYQDLNGLTIEKLDRPPSALEFARLVHISRPVIIKGFDYPALALWDNAYLTDKMGERSISIAVTPNGCADAITRAPDDRLYFVEPATEKMTMSELLNKLEKRNSLPRPQEIHYLQSQNGNLFSSDGTISEFQPLTVDVPEDVPWCSDALGQKPDAVNLWIGDERSVTSIHSDPYENIYTVVRGEKHFTLLPPTDSWCLKERLYPHATYKRSPSGTLDIFPSSDSAEVRWSSITDPSAPDTLPADVSPIHVTLRAGETLYLPVGWWHYVRQSGLTIALNWWYDAEMRGMTWVLLNFLRNTNSVIPLGNEVVLTNE